MRPLFLSVAAIALLLTASGAHASRVFVVTSDIASYKPQTVLDAEHVLAIPPGRKLVVLRPDGSERTLTDTDNGRPVRIVLDNVVEAPWWQRMLDIVRGGGAQPTQGSSRAIGSGPADWAGVASVRRGIVCAVGPKGPDLTRPASAAVLNVEIEGPSGTKSNVRFAANTQRANWPTDQTAPGMYKIRPANQPPFEITLRSLPPASGLAEVRALGAAGCEAQAADALRTLAR